MIRSLLVALLIAPAAAPAQVTSHAPAAVQIANGAEAVAPGTYLGHWPDGRPLQEVVRVISPDLITLQRAGAAGQPVPFHRIAPGLFRNTQGSTLVVEAPTRLLWTAADGVEEVTYSLQ